MAWFDVPKSVLRLALREVGTPAPLRLRLCTDPKQLRALSAAARRIGLRTAEAGLAGAGPRAVFFSDLGGNRWEVCTPIGTVSRLDGIRARAGRLLHAVAAGWSWLSTPGPVEARFRHQRAAVERLAQR
jgi:hypothetical protein